MKQWDSPNKIRSYKKPLADYFTSYIWSVKKNTCYPYICRGILLTWQASKDILSIGATLFTVKKNRSCITYNCGESDVFYQPNSTKRRTQLLIVWKHIQITYFDQLFQWYHIINCSNSTFPWISNSKRPNWCFRCDKCLFQKVYLFNRLS